MLWTFCQVWRNSTICEHCAIICEHCEGWQWEVRFCPQVFNPDPIEVQFSTQRIDNLNKNPLQWPHICTYIHAFYILMCIHIYLYNIYIYVHHMYNVLPMHMKCVYPLIEATPIRYTEAFKRNLSLSSWFEWSTWGAEGSFWCKSRWLGWCGVFCGWTM